MKKPREAGGAAWGEGSSGTGGGLERALHADGELDAEFFAAVGVGVAGGVGGVTLEVLRGVEDVAGVGEDRDALAEGVFGVEVDVVAGVIILEGVGRGAGLGGVTLAAAVVVFHHEDEGLLGEGEAGAAALAGASEHPRY